MQSQPSWNPFSSEDILNVSNNVIRLHDVSQDASLHPLEADTLCLAEREKIPLSELKAVNFHLRFEKDLLEQIRSPSTSSQQSSLENDETLRPATPTHDTLGIWTANLDFGPQNAATPLSWADIEARNSQRQTKHLISETNHKDYNNVLRALWHKTYKSTLPFAYTGVFGRAVISVISGRPSSFFTWEEERARFVCRESAFSLDRLGPVTTKALCEHVCGFGTLFRRIQTFCSTKSDATSTTNALKSSLSQILGAIELHVQQVLPQRCSFLELQAVAAPCVGLLSILDSVVRRTKTSSNEQSLLAGIVQAIDEVWITHDSLRPLLSMLAERILWPALQDTANNLRLCSIRSGLTADTWILHDLVPELQNIWYGTVESLAVIEGLAKPGVQIRTPNISISLAQNWHALIEIQREADALQGQLPVTSCPGDDVKTAIFAPTNDPLPEFVTNTDPFTADFAHRDKSMLYELTKVETSLSGPVLKYLQQDQAPPQPELSPLLALKMSVEPYLRAQHSVTSYRLLKMLFLEYDLVSHLRMLHGFAMLGDSAFAIRLSHTLFDPNQHSAEGRRTTGPTVGLRLEDRRTWPPATSEMRLVLMGTLERSDTGVTGWRPPDFLSFAIRDLSEDAMEPCRNPHSLNALGFLKLVYTPPHSLLELVISPAALDKYDRIFTFLLVLLRVHAVSQNLMAQNLRGEKAQRVSEWARKFSIEYHHFVSQLLNFVVNHAIQLSWTAFEKHIQAIKDCLRHGEYVESLRLAASVAHLRNKHELMLDEILGSLMLQQSEATYAAAVNRILQLGLDFSAKKLFSSDKAARHVYQQLESFVTNFLQLLSELSAKSQDLATQRLEGLLLTLDLSNFYKSDTTMPGI